MLNKGARNLCLIAIAMSGLTMVAACSKNETPRRVYRVKEYPLNDKATGGIVSGKVIVQELTDTSFRLYVRLSRSIKDTTYTFAIFKGDKSATALDTAFSLGSVTSLTTAAPVEFKKDIWEIKENDTQKKKFNYDSFLNNPFFARITYIDRADPANPQQKLLAIGNVGKGSN